MNLQELIDILPPEDRQIVLDHFVRNLLGQSFKEEIVIRRNATISTLGTEEEIMREVADIFGFPIEKIKTQNIADKLKEISNQQERTAAIINSYREFLLAQRSEGN